MTTTGAQLLDIPLEFEFKGKVYKVSRVITQEMEQWLADWVYNSACDRLERQKQLARNREGPGGMTEEQYLRMVDRIADNLQVGKYEWEGEITIGAMNTIPGNKMMTLLRFRRYPAENGPVSMSLIDEIYDDLPSFKRLQNLLNPTPAAASEPKKESDEQPAAEKEKA